MTMLTLFWSLRALYTSTVINGYWLEPLIPKSQMRKQLHHKTDARTIRRGKTHILILDKDDPKKELEFEVQFQLSLSMKQRYEIMDRLVKDGLEIMKKHGYRPTPTIFTRP
jgi:hypothetical protein